MYLNSLNMVSFSYIIIENSGGFFFFQDKLNYLCEFYNVLYQFFFGN